MTQVNCPICREPYETQCRCFLQDRMCRNGHFWHSCGVCGIVVLGESDHSVSHVAPVNLCGACRGSEVVGREYHMGGDG